MKKKAPYILTICAVIITALGLAFALEDGMGTNHVKNLRVQSQINFGGQIRSSWPSPSTRSISGVIKVGENLDSVFWERLFTSDSTLQTVKLQTDSGSADVKIVRSLWNNVWTNYDTLISLSPDSSGISSSGWSSNWMSNDYRVGILITGNSGATSLWWSVTYSE